MSFTRRKNKAMDMEWTQLLTLDARELPGNVHDVIYVTASVLNCFLTHPPLPLDILLFSNFGCHYVCWACFSEKSLLFNENLGHH